jgi:hypothetical protein
MAPPAFFTGGLSYVFRDPLLCFDYPGICIGHPLVERRFIGNLEPEWFPFRT